MNPWVCCNETKSFELLLSRQIRWCPGFYYYTLLSLRKNVQKIYGIFLTIANMHSMYSMLYTANLGLCNYVLYLQIRSHMDSLHVEREELAWRQNERQRSRGYTPHLWCGQALSKATKVLSKIKHNRLECYASIMQA